MEDTPKKAAPKKAAPKKAAPAAQDSAAVQAMLHGNTPVNEQAATDVDPRDEEIEALERALAEALKPPPPMDPKEVRLAELRAQLAEASPENKPEPADARDRTIAELKAQLDAIRSTPEGAAAEMAKALAALQDQVNRMQSGAGLVPVPVNENPDPFLYGAVLATGEVIYAQHPTATAHFSPEHEITVPVMSYFELDAKTAELANA